MISTLELKKQIFSINSDEQFNSLALKLFEYQYFNNKVYKQYVDLLKINISDVKKIEDIPFLPISFFKTHKILCNDKTEEVVFLSSGTGNMQRSKHFVSDLDLYEKSFFKGFENFFGNISDYKIFGLLPSYIEQGSSSLVYMVEKLMAKSKIPVGGFYLNDFENFRNSIRKSFDEKHKIFIIGVTYALIEVAEKYPINIPNAIIVETGGMKGRKDEISKNELHEILKKGFGVDKIYSEYGMAELLSQAWSVGEGKFKTSPWMKILIADTNNPLKVLQNGVGGINIIDLANMNSCPFIATQDLGRLNADGSFEILGRFDNSDIRGCSLMYF